MRRGRVVAVAALLLAAGCGTGTEEVVRERSTAASPFRVSGVPAGLELAAAGRGMSSAAWAQDDTGSDEPATVLVATDPAAAGPDAIVVSLTGVDPHPAGSDPPFDGVEDVVSPELGRDVDRYHLDGAGAAWASSGDLRELLVSRRPDTVVRVRARDGTKRLLEDVARATAVEEDHREHPDVDPPDGYRVGGWLDVDARLALYGAGTTTGSQWVPGPRSAFSLAWASEERSVGVLAIPGRSARLAGLGAAAGVDPVVTSADRFDLAGRPAWFVRNGSSRLASLVTTTDWGDVLVVTARGVDRSAQVMRRVATSIRRASSSEWQGFVDRADGGPGLRPDPGREEVLRGEVGSEQWLLQTDDEGVDGCLKLTRQRRACGYGTVDGGAAGRVLRMAPDQLQPFPRNYLVAAEVPAVTARITTRLEVAESRLGRAPGSDRRYAVVFLDTPVQRLTCEEGPDIGEARVDLLDGAGEVVTCIESRR